MQMDPINITELPDTAESGAALVHIALSGVLTADRYRFLEDALVDLTKKHHRIRVLLVLENFEGTTSRAMYRDLLNEQKLAPKLERIALVHASGETGEPAASETPPTDINRVRRFGPGETEEALRWLATD